MTSKNLVGRFGCAILTAVVVSAATTGAEAAAQTKTVVAGAEYAGKSGWHRFLFGNEYRVAWGTPITAEVLDLQSEAGGLTPVRRVGGLQTKGLALRGKDGRNYTFRGLEKDTSHLLEADLRGTIADRVLQDQMAAQHPASELVARGILDAVGVPCPQWRLVVLPDDQALGELRKDFAGAVGVFGEYPTAATPTVPGFAGATEIIDHLELYKRLEAGQGDRADTRALLKARLVDIFMGDWDRHRKQWRWARVPGNELWQPIPEDRDQALARYEGVVLDMVRGSDPRFQKMRADYPNIGGLTSNGWEQDRRLLVGLTREDFAETATALRNVLTNDVIDRAVRAMPPEWFAVDGARISAELKSRRDALPEVASKFYRHLAGRVDVYMTEQPERVEARRSAEGDLAVSIAQVGADGGVSQPYFQRTFKASETDEVRFYALGGNDTISVTGDGGGVHVRVVGGAGNDVLDASGAGNAKLSDSAGNNRVVDADLDAHPYIAPPPPRNAPWVPPRDWTHETWTMPWVAYSGDLGVFLGMGLETERYSFRKHPFGSAHIIRAGYAFGEKGGRLDYRGIFARENRSSAFLVGAYVSAAEVLRFYGFGNETANIGDEDFYRVSANQAVLFPAFLSRWGKSTRFAIGPLLKYTNTNEEDAQFINEVRPYGVGEFGELGMHATLNVDTSDHPVFPRKGVRFSLRATLIPEVWDVESTFGSVGTDASAYLSAGRRLTLAVRAGGKRNFGDYPFFDAATIGGGGLGTGPLQEPADTVRGFRSRRFMGDASLYGNAELRLRVSHITLVLPGNWGLNGFVDSGRVFLDDEDSSIWHTGVGGGIWLSLLNDRFAVSGGLAHSDEDDLIYFKGGFSF